MDSLNKMGMNIPKGYKNKEWQSACKIGRDIYIFGGINNGPDYYSGKLIRLNIDSMSIEIHETINKIPSRFGHASCLYSIGIQTYRSQSSYNWRIG